MSGYEWAMPSSRVGNTTLTRKNGAIYKYMRTTGGTAAWTELSSADPANYQNYMAALSDMLAEDEQSLDTGRFSVLFARTLASMSAMIETLMTQTLIIKTGGMIKSEGFDSGTGAGFKLDSDGTLTARNGVFSGTVNASSGSFSGDISTRNVIFNTTAGNVIFRSFRVKSIQYGEHAYVITQVYVTGSLRFRCGAIGSWPSSTVERYAGKISVYLNDVLKQEQEMQIGFGSMNVDLSVQPADIIKIDAFAYQGVGVNPGGVLQIVSWWLGSTQNNPVAGGVGMTSYDGSYEPPTTR